MKGSLSVRAPAKINLSLDVIGKRCDGYHLMKMVMQTVSLFDIITVIQNKSQRISISCNDLRAPTDKSNLVYKATEQFFKYINLENQGIEIVIDKNIPMQAGLGGGSADAAGMLVALNELYSTKLSEKELCSIGEKLGADVPFCIVGGTALAEGIGEIITPLPYFNDCVILIAKGKEGIKTPEAFKKIDNLASIKHPKTDEMISSIASRNINKVALLCENVFEQVTVNKEITMIKKTMINNGALCSVMSGSGSAVFGIFAEKHNASVCLENLQNNVEFVQICSPVKSGPQII